MIGANQGTAMAFKADVTKDAEIKAMVADAHGRWGRIDILHNNAADTRPEFMAQDTSFPDMTIDVWDRTFAINTRGPMLMIKHVVPHMIAGGGGSIINTGSGWGLKGGGQALSYCDSKGAVVNMTRALAIDHGPAGIRVNSVNPGDVNTGMLRDEARQLAQDTDAFLAEAADRPLRRMGEPSEVAQAVVWLASDDSSYVTGSALVVDGGGIA